MRDLALTTIVTCALIVGSSTSVDAQVCLGNGADPGGFGVAGQLGLDDGSKHYGIEGAANLESPIAFRGEFELVDLDGTDANQYQVEGLAAYDLNDGSDWSLCPNLGVGHTWATEEATEAGVTATLAAERTFVPIGFALGKRFSIGTDASIAPFATPQFLVVREEFVLEVAGEREEVSDTGWDARTDLGLLLEAGQIYGSVGTGVFLPSGDPPALSPSIRITGGVAF